MDTYVVKRLEQAKLLTDPFKLKLLERFGGKPVTTKQVADRMGEKAPRLYRHVDALVDEGLLELVEEKPKRGTIERYYRTVATRFEVDPGLFSTSSGVGDDAVNMLRGLFRDTESDLVTLFDKYRDAEPDRRCPADRHASRYSWYAGRNSRAAAETGRVDGRLQVAVLRT